MASGAQPSPEESLAAAGKRERNHGPVPGAAGSVHAADERRHCRALPRRQPRPRKVRPRRRHPPQPAPDVVTYNTLLAAHCRVAGLNAGLAVVHRMREAGVSPDAVTYYSLIAGATRRGLTLRALDLFDEMLRSGIAPDSWSYNALMHCLFRSGYPEEAYRVFTDITEKGVAPSTTTYNTCSTACSGLATRRMPTGCSGTCRGRGSPWAL